MRFLIAAALIVSVTASFTMAEAAIYQWRDDKGVVHFTDNSDNIPVRYESRVKEVAGSPAEKEKPKAAETAVSQPAPPAAPVAATSGAAGSRNAELQALRATVAKKREELAKLRRKWVLAKGRKPSKEEVEEFEKKRAKGEAKLEDNPYMNRSPLSSPGPARLAYYKKLEEIKGDEERIRELESELEGK